MAHMTHVTYDDKRFPVVLKSRFGAYDGKGNYVVQEAAEATKGFDALGRDRLYVQISVSILKLDVNTLTF